MAFRDILKKQRQSGEGLISSIASASNKSILESIDPRNKIFKRGSLLNSLFPNVKGYSADGDKSLAKVVTPQQTSAVVNAEVSAKLNVVADKLDIVGKNTMVLPLMMRDSNIMRQSLIKLVKLSGGTQRDKADRFFQTSKDRESLYESQFKKKSTSPTPTVAKTDSGGGFLDMLLKGLLAGGILAGIGKLMEDPAIRAIVKDYVQKFVTSVFDGIKFILSTIMETEIDIEGFKMSLGTAIAGVIGTFVGLKVAIAALTAYILKKIGGASIPSTGIPDGPDRGKPGDKPGNKTPVPGAPGTPGKTDEKPNSESKKPEKYRDPKTGRYAKMPKPGMTPDGAFGKLAGVAAILGLAADLVYTSDSDIAILRDSGFSKSKVFDKLTEEEQDGYLEKVYTKDVKESEVKAEREALMKKYNLEATGTMLRFKEQYIEKPTVTPTPVIPAPPAGAQASVRAIDNAAAPKTFSQDVAARKSASSPMKASNTTPSANKTALDITASTEGGGRYDLAFGDKAQKDGTIVNVLGKSKNFPQLAGKNIMTPQDFSGKSLTEMTLAEVQSFQEYKNREAPNTSALGKYGFMGATLFGKDGKSGLVGQLKLPMDTIFSPDTQELLQATMRKDNADTLKKKGVAPTDANLNLANIVGAGGVAELLKPENANKNALDVLGYARDGAVALTNPGLNKLSKDVIAETYSKYDANGMAPSGVTQPPATMLAQAPSTMVTQAPSTPTRPATQIASASISLADARTDARNAFGTNPIIINSPTGKMPQQPAQQTNQAQYTAPAVVDSEFMKLLVDRAVA